MLDAGRVGRRLNVSHVGVQNERHRIAVGQVLHPTSGETFPHVVEAPESRADRVLVEGRQTLADLVPQRFVVAHLAELELIVHGRVVGRQLRIGDGPAAVRHPRPVPEIDVVEQRASAAPDIGGAPQKAQAGIDQIVVGHAFAATGVEVLSGLLEIQAAALQQADGMTELGQTPGQRNAGRAGAGNADVSLESLAMGQLVEIEQHH